MNFIGNFFQSIGSMNGNQWVFVGLTNAVTGEVTYYATRKAYEVDDEEEDKKEEDEEEEEEEDEEDEEEEEEEEDDDDDDDDD